MKIKKLITALALAMPVGMLAAPASPGPLTMVNPDGTTVEIYAHGDEFFGYTTNADNQLMAQDAQGYWRPMIENGRAVYATEQKVSEMFESKRPEVENLRRAARGQVERMAQLDNAGQTKYPTTSTDIHSCVVLVQFKDTKFNFEDPVAEYNEWLNAENYNKYNCIGSVRDYYIKNSDGKFKPTFDVVGLVTLPETSKYYVGNRRHTPGTIDGSKYDHWNEAMTTALQQLNPEVDFSKYDYDQDGIIDTIYYIYAGYGQADTLDQNCIWPHQSTIYNLGMKLDGLYAGPYACSNELCGSKHYYSKDMMPMGIGTFCHEFGHVLGLPDLYDVNYNPSATTPGKWSVMCDGSYLPSGDATHPVLYSSYERWLCHWIDYEPAVDGTDYTLQPQIRETRTIRIPTRNIAGTESKNEYFLLENRIKEGWDLFLPSEGMVIWHIDYAKTYWANNRVNADARHPRVSVVTSDGTGNWWLGNGGTADRATWPSDPSETAMITPTSEITLNTYQTSDVQNANCFITDIKFDYDTKLSTFGYNKVTEAPDTKTVMFEPVRLKNEDGSESYKVKLSWEPVDDADSYILTVWNVNSSGKKYTEAGLNETNIGNVTEYILPEISEAKRTRKYYAYVRVNKLVPSSQQSETIEFVPAELAIGESGVETIIEGTPAIFGLTGRIIAPQGAEIYNLGGVRVAADNLAAGIYMVRYNGAITKVIVK